MRAWRFSSVTSSLSPLKAAARARLYALSTPVMGTRSMSIPRFLASRAELLLAPAGVVQARAEDLVEIEVGHHQVFLEGPATRDPLALLVEDEGLPVEDELVLAAHRVDEGQADEIVGGPRGQHLLAELGLARVVGRGVDRHHELGPRQGLQGGGPRGIPDVLADVGREHRVAHDEHGRLRAGLEVAVLVEDAVVA